MTQQPDCDSIQIVPDADKLDQYHRQQLSAMLDGELSPDQARFMLRRLQHDVELAERWERWQVCGDVLRGQGNALLPPDFSSRVSSAIADAAPQPVEQRARSSGRRGLRWGGGAALAASVAMAALLVGRQAGPVPEQAPVRSVPAVAATAVDAPAAIASAPVEAFADDTADAVGPVLAEAAPEQAQRGPDAPVARQQQVQVATVSRREQQPAATRSDRPAPAQPSRMIAAATPAPAPVEVAPAEDPVVVPFPSANRTAVALLPAPAQGIGADPFQSLPMTVGSRPWPRAGAGVDNAYAVGLGQSVQPASTWLLSGLAQPPAAERFGLPPEAVAGMARPQADTAIGAGAVPGAETQVAPQQAGHVDPAIGPR